LNEFEIASLKRDIDTLEKDNDRLKKKCGEYKSGPSIVTSKSSNDKRQCAKELVDTSANCYTQSSKNSSGDDVIDIIDSVCDAASDVGEAVGEVVSAVLD
jgi:hypothetical protein